MYNTIIIGGGAVGSYLAGKLAHAGYRVLVLDKKSAAGLDICCTGIVSKACLDLLSIDEALIMRQMNTARFFAASGKAIRLQRKEPVAYVIERSSLDQALADRAQSYGAYYLFDIEATDIQLKKDSVHVTTSCGDQEKLLEAETVVIATGFGSPLLAHLGLGKISDYAVGAQAEINLTEPGDVEIYFDQRLAPGGFAWLVPARNNTGLAGVLTREQPKRHLNTFLSILKTQGKITSTEVTARFGTIPLRPLRKTYSDRMLVVGKAAGQVKPTSGGGIYYGLLCADLAAQTLHQGFQSHDLSASRLALYQKRWRARLGKELRVSYWANRIYGKLSNRQIDSLHYFISNNGLTQLIAELDDPYFDWHSELILKALKHLAVAIPVQLIKSMVKTRST